KISEKQIKEEINLIKNKIVEITTVLKKEPETETKPKIRIDLRGYIFIKDQQENGMKVGDKKLEILRVLSDKKPKTMFQIAEMVKYKDDRRVVPAITEINNSIKKLTGGSDLIINLGAGYCFNTSNLLISFINKK
ncbi:MAG: hypothetical protein NTX85_02530, partial [Candidatus Nomurabacteria bacterium]|nr:hypothetical protein [Candidatus Nomurabacteria bacterium]